MILKESIRINGKDAEDPNVNIGTTVQEKNITFPTDAKLNTFSLVLEELVFFVCPLN